MSDITRAAPAPQEIGAPLTASIAESGIEIGARRYVSAQRVASMLGVSLRTLSRWTRQAPVHRKSRSAKRSSTTSASLPNG